MNPHPLLANMPTNHDQADSLISKMGARGHSKEVLQWRKDEFLRMGFTDPMSSFLSHTHIDLHIMEHRFLKRGCEHAVAIDILLGTNFIGEDPNWNWQGTADEREENVQD